MTAFTFATATTIVFGRGEAARLPDRVSGLGGRVLVCTGATSGRHAQVLDGLGDEATFAVPGEPSVESVAEATDVARSVGADVVVAVGGGSVIDLGKAVAALLTNGGDPLDYLEVVGRGLALTARSAPLVAVPTTAGTGAEVTANAVLTATVGTPDATSPAGRVKVSMRSPLMLPALALVDPELTASCPPAVTASSGLDALTQCLEPYVSSLANPLTDGFAAEGLRRAAGGLRRAVQDGSDEQARTDMALCSLLGGLALANAKLGAVHGLAGVIGGLLDAPHGLVCAALLAPVTEANLRALRSRATDDVALRRFADVGALLTGRGDAGAEDAVAWIRETVAALEVPGLAEVGLTPELVDQIVDGGQRASSTRGNPVALTAEELRGAVLAAR